MKTSQVVTLGCRGKKTLQWVLQSKGACEFIRLDWIGWEWGQLAGFCQHGDELRVS